MNLSGGILAGGEGRRFDGADKGWIEYRGRAFIDHALAALSGQVDDITISANRNLSRYAQRGYPVVRDTVGQGPLAGMLRLLECARHPWLLCVPCDAVALPSDMAHRMMEAQRSVEADIVIAHDGTRDYPVLCLLRRELVADLRHQLDAGRYAVWQWQTRHRVARAQFPAPLLNINDADALRRLSA